MQTKALAHRFVHAALMKGFQRRKLATVMPFFWATESHPSPETTR